MVYVVLLEPLYIVVQAGAELRQGSVMVPLMGLIVAKMRLDIVPPLPEMIRPWRLDG
jgi:hypothetical protein